MGFADIKSFSFKIVGANTDTQIFWSPWRAQRRYFLNKLVLTNENSTATIVKFHDDDLSNATPPIRGDSVNAPLLEVYVPANSTVFIDERMCPKEFFISGMVANSVLANVVVTAEIKED